MPRNPADNPAAIYLDSLAPGSYWAVRHSLETIAGLLGGDDTGLFRGGPCASRLRRGAVGGLKRFAPTTVNRLPSALRGVLKNARRLGLMDAETYWRAVEVENMKAKT